MGKRTKSHIVAMGGGGFSMEPKNGLLDDFALSLTGKRRPVVCFIGTASGDAQGYIDRFHRAFPKSRARATHLPLFNRGPDLKTPIMSADVIYVGGGNTANLLAIWRLHGVDRLVQRAWRKGTVLCGVSAGMICWFSGCVTDSFGQQLAPLNDGLGFLPGSACPHYDGEKLRRPVYQKLVASGALPAGYAADDFAALHFEGRRFVEAVSSRSHARAYRVERVNGKAVETPIVTRFLGG